MAFPPEARLVVSHKNNEFLRKRGKEKKGIEQKRHRFVNDARAHTISMSFGLCYFSIMEHPK